MKYQHIHKQMPIDSSDTFKNMQSVNVPEDLDSLKQQTTVQANKPVALVQEIDGFNGPEPTRYGDWEKNGRCIDF